MRAREIGGLAALACATAFAPSTASAQATFQPNWAGWGSANLGMNALAHQQAQIHGAAGSRGAVPPPRRAAVSTTYRRDPAVTRKVADSFADYVAQVSDAAKAQAVRQQLAQNDIAQSWSRMTEQDGFHAGDVADALSAYWILNWVMANGSDSNSRQAAGARAQLHSTLPASPAFARLSETQRQEMAETYMVNFLYQQGSYTDALKRHDTALQRRLSDAAQARFANEMHVDLRGLALTNQGFVKRG